MKSNLLDANDRARMLAINVMLAEVQVLLTKKDTEMAHGESWVLGGTGEYTLTLTRNERVDEDDPNQS